MSRGAGENETMTTPFQADFAAKTFEDQVTCLRRWSSDPATHGRYHEAMGLLFKHDQDVWLSAVDLTAHHFRV